MGESFSKFTNYISQNRVANGVLGVISRKRKYEDDEEENDQESNLVLERILHTPKRKKLVCTSQYIFQALFKEGKGSDVSVVMLGRTWRLHKVYLSQSPYFASMFSGAWREANEKTIRIDIVDSNVTLDSLEVVLGSLYLDEMVIKPTDVTSTLAAATLFHLDGIIDQCVEIMTETVNVKTAVSYYNTACTYSLATLKEAAFKWLLVNLMSFVNERPDSLREINSDLMRSLVASPDLFVIQIEFSLYALLRRWVYLRLRLDGEAESSQQYFSQRRDEASFLETPAGQQFTPVFHALRLNQLINHLSDVETLTTDNLLPWRWFTPHTTRQWYQMLRCDGGLDKGPHGISPELFSGGSLRCGRTLKNEGESVWRWTGFNFGMDLVWTVTSTLSGLPRKLKVRRNHRPDSPVEILLSQQTKRNVMVRVTVASLDDQRQVKHCVTTGLRSVKFHKNQELVLLSLDPELTYPLHISVNLLVATPPPASMAANADVANADVANADAAESPMIAMLSATPT